MQVSESAASCRLSARLLSSPALLDANRLLQLSSPTGRAVTDQVDIVAWMAAVLKAYCYRRDPFG